jgi:AraC-like DNA-binding protein
MAFTRPAASRAAGWEGTPAAPLSGQCWQCSQRKRRLERFYLDFGGADNPLVGLAEQGGSRPVRRLSTHFGGTTGVTRVGARADRAPRLSITIFRYVVPKMNSAVLISTRNLGSAHLPSEVWPRLTPVKREMPGSVVSLFSEAEEFEVALHEEGCTGLLVTGRGVFRSRLSRVALHCLHLLAAEEQLARIAVIMVPVGTVLVTFAIGGAQSPVWAGIEIGTDHIITVGPGTKLHVRTSGPARWGAVRIRERDLLKYGGILTGPSFAIPDGITRWRPTLAAARQLYQLHRAAIRVAETRSAPLADRVTAHGLEQQIIDALIECLSPMAADEETPAARRHRKIVARVEELLQAEPAGRVTDICGEVSASGRLVRECCSMHLGISPTKYRRLRAMQQVHRELRNGDPETLTVSEAAKRHGFAALGRFARNYRAIYGELPSATLRGDLSQMDLVLSGDT